jgi:hypothetical protein
MLRGLGLRKSRLTGGGGREKSEGKNGLAFVVSRPCRKCGGMDGAPSFVVEAEGATAWVGYAGREWVCFGLARQHLPLSSASLLRSARGWKYT